MGKGRLLKMKQDLKKKMVQKNYRDHMKRKEEERNQGKDVFVIMIVIFLLLILNSFFQAF